MDYNFTPKEIEKFWRRVDRSGGPDACWEYRGSRDSKGYGHVSRGRNRPRPLAHRVAYTLASGEPIPAGRLVCHSCDNPSCVNPNHLWLGDYRDNARDMFSKGRDNHRTLSGDDHWIRKNPERIRRGADHWSAHKPERIARGEAANKSCITAEDVMWIRRVYQPRHPEFGATAIAKKFGVTKTAIVRIAKRKSWSHV